jgi:hypothetical protein
VFQNGRLEDAGRDSTNADVRENHLNQVIEFAPG